MCFHRSIEMVFVLQNRHWASLMLGNTFFGMNVLQTFSDPSQVPLSRLKQRAQAEMGNIRVQSTTTGFVGREGLRCEARPLDLFKSSQDTTRAS